MPTVVQKQISHDDVRASHSKQLRKADTLITKLLSDKKKRADTVSNNRSYEQS